jgi:predicted ABC-type ATPase
VIRKLNEAGYFTLLVYLWLPYPDLAVERVGNRVRLGGHDVPEADVRRRFYRSLVNFRRLYSQITHEWRVYHALRLLDEPDLRVIAHGVGDAAATVVDEDAWLQIQKQVDAHSGDEA